VVTYGVRGILSCWDTSGKKLWTKDDFHGSWPMFFTASSPLITDGMCIAQLGGQNNGAIVAYDLGSGEQKWKWSGDGAAYSSPVLITLGGTKAIVAETDKNVVAVSLTEGKLLWQTPFAGARMSYNAATPIIDGQTVIYAGSGRGTKAVKLEAQGDKFEAKELWSNSANGVQFNTPVLRNGLVFGLSDRDKMFCINAQDGQAPWTSQVSGRRGFGSIVDVGSALLLLTPTAQLMVVEPSDKEYKQLATYKVSDGEIYATPVPAASGLFIKDKDSVTLWTVE
jgi:outer membrane protein assembly factor BamB